MRGSGISRHASAPAAASPEAASGGIFRGYLGGRLTRLQRVLVGLVGVALLPVFFVPVLPVWRMHLVAPQYREGLDLWIHVNTLKGDLRNINILNHYVGMKAINPEDFPEFGYMPAALSLFGVVAILAALFGRRWLAFLGWAGFAAFGTGMMLHFAGWLRDYGTQLDPKAALQLGPFVPPLFGTAHRGNFVIQSLPSYGGFILFGAGILGPILVLSDLLGRKRSARLLTTASLFVAASALPAGATEFTSYAPPPKPSVLAERVAAAAPGDTLRLAPGRYRGQLILDKKLVVVGTAEAVLDGEGNGTVVVVRAPGIELRGFTVTGSGYQLLLDEAGILIDQADDVSLEDLHILDCNHGVYVKNALRPRILRSEFVGRRSVTASATRARTAVDTGDPHGAGAEDLGNAIHIWYVRDALLEGNRITGYRDGIYLSFAEAAVVRGNLASEVTRFGLHSMYSQKITIADNLFARNVAGVALMFSNRMIMEGNRFAENRGHRTYGLLLRDCSDSRFTGNRLESNTIGLFLDGSNRNRFEQNLFAENGWGLIAYSSSEGNVFTRNTFLDNDYPVSLDMRRTRNRLDEEGRGNFWSDARPYDLDANGGGDAPYCPVGLFSFISKQYPDLTVFAGSPAVLALDVAQRTLPALQPTELVDPHPLLEPAPIPAFKGPSLLRASGSEPARTAALGLTGLVAALSGAALLFRRR